MCSDYSIDNGASYLVVNRTLVLTCGCDEKLIFNVDVVLGIPYQLAVSVLNAVLIWKYTATPVCTTPHNLGLDSASIFKILSLHRIERMVDVVTNRELGSLNTD